MNEDRRPPRIHRPAADDPATRTITFTLADKRQFVITPPRETADQLFANLADSINNGITIVLNDPNGSKTVLNPAHIVTVEFR